MAVAWVGYGVTEPTATIRRSVKDGNDAESPRECPSMIEGNWTSSTDVLIVRGKRQGGSLNHPPYRRVEVSLKERTREKD